MKRLWRNNLILTSINWMNSLFILITNRIGWRIVSFPPNHLVLLWRTCLFCCFYYVNIRLALFLYVFICFYSFYSNYQVHCLFPSTSIMRVLDKFISCICYNNSSISNINSVSSSFFLLRIELNDPISNTLYEYNNHSNTIQINKQFTYIYSLCQQMKVYSFFFLFLESYDYMNTHNNLSDHSIFISILIE